MQTISTQHNGYKVAFNGSNTYMIIDCWGDCYETADTKLKIKNRMKKLCKCLNMKFIDF